jgi:hypothetical protein
MAVAANSMNVRDIVSYLAVASPIIYICAPNVMAQIKVRISPLLNPPVGLVKIYMPKAATNRAIITIGSGSRLLCRTRKTGTKRLETPVTNADFDAVVNVIPTACVIKPA